MIALPSTPISAPAKPAPTTAARSADSQDDIKQSQEDDRQFHEELTREVNALQGQTPPTTDAKDARDSAGPANSAVNRDKSDDAPEPAVSVDAALAVMRIGGASMSATIVDIRAFAAKTVDVKDSHRLSGEASGASAAPLDAEPLPAAPSDGKPFAAIDLDSRPLRAATLDTGLAPGELETAAAAAPALMSAPRYALGNNARADARQTGMPMAAHTSADQESSATASGKARAELVLSASEALAESAASGKFVPAGPEKTDLAAAPDARLQHLQEGAPQASMNIGATAQARGSNAQSATAVIATHLNAPGWDRGLGEKVVWMAGQHVQTAQLHLNPPDLGPLQVTLTISNDQASAQFVSQHAAVREAIESAMPRLREMLADGGITLGNTSVGAESFREQAQQDSRSHAARGSARADVGGVFQVTQSLRAAQGLVDIFA